MARLALLLSTAAALVACSERTPPTGAPPAGVPAFAATTVTDTDKQTVQLVGTTCAGVPVTAIAEFTFVFKVTSDGQGGFHLGIHSSGAGTGTDALGTEYSASGEDHFMVYAGPAGVFTLQESLHFLSRGSTDNFVGAGIFVMTVTPNGEVNTAVDRAFTTCDS